MKNFFVALMILLLPLKASAMAQDISIDGYGGTLSAIIQTPDGLQKFPLVILCHGFTGEKNSPLLKLIADKLEANGIASIRFDFNGHGQSYGAFQSMTVPNEIEDAKKVFEFAEKLEGVTSIGVAGHSQGGVVTGMMAGELGAKKISAIALMAPAPILRDDSIRGRLLDLKYDPLNPPEYIELKLPYGTFRVGRDYILTAQTLPIFETTELFTGPALMIHGTGDVISPYTYSLSYKKILRHGEVELLERADHGFSGREQHVAKSVVGFFLRHLK